MEMFLPLSQMDSYSAQVVIRTAMERPALIESLRSALRPFDATLPVADVRELQVLVDRAVSPRRFFMSLLSAFAALALILSAVGLYGVIAYAVAQRRREIAIRMAVGAPATAVRRRVLRDALRLAVGGILIGAALYVPVAGLLRSLLYEVTPFDPLVLATVVVLLFGSALAAGYVPAVRASRLDPMEALRVE
jgi:ABC-type antimicrobial peptide transport system permease subunit